MFPSLKLWDKVQWIVFELFRKFTKMCSNVSLIFLMIKYVHSKYFDHICDFYLLLPNIFRGFCVCIQYIQTQFLSTGTKKSNSYKDNSSSKDVYEKKLKDVWMEPLSWTCSSMGSASFDPELPSHTSNVSSTSAMNPPASMFLFSSRSVDQCPSHCFSLPLPAICMSLEVKWRGETW